MTITPKRLQYIKGKPVVKDRFGYCIKNVTGKYDQIFFMWTSYVLITRVAGRESVGNIYFVDVGCPVTFNELVK